MEAQSGRVEAFAGHAAVIQGTVEELVHLVPDALRDANPAVEGALGHMVDHCISLTLQCSKDPGPGRQETLSCQVPRTVFVLFVTLPLCHLSGCASSVRRGQECQTSHGPPESTRVFMS